MIWPRLPGTFALISNHSKMRIAAEQTNYVARGSGLVIEYSNLLFLVTAGHVIPQDEDVHYGFPGKNGGEPQNVPHKAVAAYSGLN